MSILNFFILIFFLKSLHVSDVKQKNHILSPDSLLYYYDHCLYQKGINWYRSHQDHLSENTWAYCLALKTAGNCYKAIRKYDTAEVLYKRSLQCSKKFRHNPDFLVRTYANLGALQNIRGKHDHTMKYYNKALKTLYSQQENLFPQLFFQIGIHYDNIYQLDSALIYYHVAEDSVMSIFGEGSAELHGILLGKANLYYKKGEYEKAKTVYQNALSLIEKHPYSKVINVNQLRLYRNIALCHKKLKQYREALSILLSAERKAMSPQSIYRISKIYSDIGYLYCYLNKYDSAQIYFEKSIQVPEETDTLSLAIACRKYGNFLLIYKNDIPGSHKYYLTAKKYYESIYGRLNEGMISIYTCLGTIEAYRDSSMNALEYFQLALKCIDTSLNQKDFAANLSAGYPPSLKILDIVLRKIYDIDQLLAGKNYKDLYLCNCLLENLDYYTRGFERLILDKTLMTDQINQYRTGLRKYINKGMRVAWELYKITGKPEHISKGFELSEKARSLILKAMFYKQNIGKRLPKKLAKQEEELRNTISLTGKMLRAMDQNESKEHQDSLRSVFVNLLRKHEKIMGKIRKKHPGYFSMYYTHTPSIAEIRTKLAEEEVMIEFFVADSSLYSFVLSRDTLMWHNIFLNSELQNEIHSQIIFTDIDHENRITQEKYQNTALKLYKILIEPAIKNSNATKLLIIPDGKLCFFPFEVLLTRKVNAENTYRDLPYLIRNYTLSYNYSAMFISKKTADHRQKANLAILVPDYCKLPDGSITFLTPIKKALQEANELKEMMNGRLIHPAEMSIGQLKQKIKNYGMLHFVAHTMLNAQNPLYSKLVYSNCPDDTTGVQDLFAIDICNMQLNAQMAVLSSCNTGYGKMVSGEGIMSLAWAFRYAGCHSIIMTLNAIEDNSARIIMLAYYKNLEAGMEKDEALRQAKLKYLETILPSKSHPKYWAGIISIGDQSPVFSKANGYSYMIWIPVACCLILMIIFHRSLFRKLFK